MRSQNILLPLLGCFACAGAAQAQCTLVRASEAAALLGSDITDLSGDDAQTQCAFLSNENNTMFIVQFSNREYFDQVTLLEPFSEVDIGDAGRARTEANGGAAVQFVTGDRSVTMSVRPIRPGADLLAPLISIARALAERLE